MAPSFRHFLLIFLSFSSLVFVSQSQSHSHSQTQTIFKPNKLVLPVQKDSATALHVANIHSPLSQAPFLVDLNGQFMWANCKQQYLSSTFHAPYCHSTQCSRANSHNCRTCSSAASRPPAVCHNNTCGLIAVNPVTHQTAMAELAQDVFSIQSTQGQMARVPQFLFACAPSLLLQKGLPKNAQGVVGLGHAPISVPTQLSSHFGFQPKFALCLTSSPRKNGVIFFGDVPFSHNLSFTPLSISRKGEYFIQVKSIRINNKLVPLNTPLSSMISTTDPYTVLERSVFKTVSQLFADKLSDVAGISRVKPPVAPFEVCYDSSKIASSVPNVDLVLHTQNVVWRIFGANLMVKAREGVTCLGLVDGGPRPRASIVIGAYQLEDNLLQFDLARSRLGFRRTNCANFNFTVSR
ncbi:gamma conglutin 1-like [Alnus glutinosa]|uniref:gamma conglutin 1-like n=1 Tax=Alnus glutinosa TaxID=3517 RepID=UPI002D76C20A|nr:gamma conglutin 1-like [Alnus glutinosa]